MIGNISQFWRITRELDLNALRQDFERRVVVQVLGSDLQSAERIARLLDPEALGKEVQVGTLSDWGVARHERRAGPPADAFVVAMDAGLHPAARRTLTDLSIGETPLLLVQLGRAAEMLVLGVPEERILDLGEMDDQQRARDRLIEALVRLVPEAMLPLGRAYPHLREPVADHLIRDTSRVNAQFAAMSSLPASIPLVGGIIGDVADIVVLTKNQVILLFKLAGLYGRDLQLGQQLLVEVAPVVGGAFVWRTAARSVVGLLPTPFSLVPKAVIAYSGTFLVGEMARYYYTEGRKPPEEVVKQLQAEALRVARATAERLRLNKRSR